MTAGSPSVYGNHYETQTRRQHPNQKRRQSKKQARDYQPASRIKSRPILHRRALDAITQALAGPWGRTTQQVAESRSALAQPTNWLSDASSTGLDSHSAAAGVFLDNLDTGPDSHDAHASSFLEQEYRDNFHYKGAHTSAHPQHLIT